MSTVSKAKSVVDGVHYPLSIDETEDDQGQVVSVLGNDGKVLCDTYDTNTANKIKDSLDVCSTIARESLDIASLVCDLPSTNPDTVQAMEADITKMLEILRIVDVDGVEKVELQKVISMFAAQARFMQDEMVYDSDNLKRLFRALTVVSKNRQPGSVCGLARHHKSQNKSWSMDTAMWKVKIMKDE